jgi:hypothetical protein
MMNNLMETQALSLDALPVDIINLTLHYLAVPDWFHFSLTSKRCLQLHKEARMPKLALIDIRHDQSVESFIRKVARWNTIFTEETGHLCIRHNQYAYNYGSTVDSIEKMIAQEGFQLTGVSSLNLSLAGRRAIPNCVFRGLALMLPNLTELNISGVLVENFSGDLCFCELFPNLTSLTWNVAGLASFIRRGGIYRPSSDLKGSCFRMASTLRELYLEDSVLLFSCAEREINLMLASEPMQEQAEGDIWLFCECPSPLERIDLKGVRYSSDTGRRLPIPQKALVKLVRRSPNLKWLRSDLSKENIAMLQLEKFDLTFLST